VVELAPQLDSSGVSAVLAAKVTRSLLLLLGQAHGGGASPEARLQ
jgi:agmatinase